MCDSTHLPLCNEALRHIDQGLLVTCIEMALDSFIDLLNLKLINFGDLGIYEYTAPSEEH